MRATLAVLLCLTAVTAAVPARAAAPGALDRGFGAGGLVTSELDDDLVPVGGGGFLIAGSDRGGAAAVERRRPDGALDPSFGVGGRALVGVDGRVSGVVAVPAPDGGVAVAGAVRPPGSDERSLAVARFGPDGRPDPAFGRDGVTVAGDLAGFDVNTNRPVAGLAAGAGGRIVVLTSALELRAFGPGGDPDRSFGRDGVVTVPPDRIPPGEVGSPAGLRMVQAPGGELIVLGISGGRESPGAVDLDYTTFLVRFSPDGAFDRGFGADGRIDVGADGAALVRQPSGRFAVGHRACEDKLGPCPLAVELTGPGGGWRMAPGTDAVLMAVAADAGGRLVLGGGDTVARLRADGSPDLAFGACGAVSTAALRRATRYRFSPIADLAAQDGGGILVGHDFSPSATDTRSGSAVVRLQSAGRAPTAARPRLIEPYEGWEIGATVGGSLRGDAVTFPVHTPQRARLRTTVALVQRGRWRTVATGSARTTPCRAMRIRVRWDRAERRRLLRRDGTTRLRVAFRLSNRGGTRTVRRSVYLRENGRLVTFRP